MPAPIYIFGHKNPDADAICSVIAYEAFKHATGHKEYVAARCGHSNARIDAILSHFETPLPRFIGDVTPRLSDIMQRKICTVTRESTCAEALELIDKYDVRALPVVDENNRIEGLISIFQLGDFFIPKPQKSTSLRCVHTSVQSIIDSLNAKVLHVHNPESLEELYLRVGAMDITSFKNYHKEQGVPAQYSIIIVGDRSDIQEHSLRIGVRMLVITGNLEVSDEVIHQAKERDICLIVSPYDSATTSWIIRTATHISKLIDPEVSCFHAKDLISCVKRRIANSNEPLYLVENESGQLVGVFSKSDILRPSETRIALLDHNELGQAVNGADEVRLVEIIDHHRLGNIPTEYPILFINLPVGSTSSIVADLFRSHSLTPEPNIAGILMAGIISDTLSLKSPTTTELEGELLDWLSPIAGITQEKLADIIFSVGSIIVSNEPDEVIRSDCKIYNEGGIRYSVSQIEELGFDNFWKSKDALNQALVDYCTKEGLLFSFLLATDVNTHSSLLLVAGNKEVRDAISYPQSRRPNIYELSGIVSRKKQLIPYISRLLKTIGML